MLVSIMGDDRIDAAIAVRGPDFRCPGCKGIVILHKGRKVIAHFKHKPPTDCTWAKGETKAHLEAKRILFDALTGRGHKAQIECVIPALPGDRRADVVASSPKGQQVAIELQHTPIGLDEIERRAFSYAREGIAQIWVPFVRPSVWKNGKKIGKMWFVERYAARPFERWIHGLNMKCGMWMYDPDRKVFWLGRLKEHEIYVEETRWYAEGGEENYGGGYSRTSKLFKELTLEGPYEAGELLITINSRSAFRTKTYNWPAGYLARFVLA